MLCVPPTLCCTASRCPAPSATTTPWPAPAISDYTPAGWTVLYLNRPFGGIEEPGIELLPPIKGTQGNGRPVPGAHHTSLAGQRQSAGSARRHVVGAVSKPASRNSCRLRQLCTSPNYVRPYTGIKTNPLFNKGQPYLRTSGTTPRREEPGKTQNPSASKSSTPRNPGK